MWWRWNEYNWFIFVGIFVRFGVVVVVVVVVVGGGGGAVCLMFKILFSGIL